MRVAGEFTDEGLVGLCICGVWHLRRFERRRVRRFGEFGFGWFGSGWALTLWVLAFSEFLTEDFGV